MRNQANLIMLGRRYSEKLNRIESRFNNVLRLPNSKHNGKSDLAYCTIELMNGYRAFNRALLVSSAIGAKTSQGRIAKVAGVCSEYDFICKVFGLIGKSVNATNRTWKSRDEPAWEAQVNSLAAKLALPNAVEISAAFSISSFYKELKIFRDFFCHRSRDLFYSADSVAQGYLISGCCAEELLLQQMNGGGFLVNYWIEQCKIYSEFAIE